jgi:hypothetical protein
MHIAQVGPRLPERRLAQRPVEPLCELRLGIQGSNGSRAAVVGWHGPCTLPLVPLSIPVEEET